MSPSVAPARRSARIAADCDIIDLARPLDTALTLPGRSTQRRLSRGREDEERCCQENKLRGKCSPQIVNGMVF